MEELYLLRVHKRIADCFVKVIVETCCCESARVLEFDSDDISVLVEINRPVYSKQWFVGFAHGIQVNAPEL